MPMKQMQMNTANMALVFPAELMMLDQISAL
jgi:hypothetical protein